MRKSNRQTKGVPGINKAKKGNDMRSDQLVQEAIETMTSIVRLSSTSGHEENVRSYIENRLRQWDIAFQVDQVGNLIARIPANQVDDDVPPLLLNAHMDRVPNGLGCDPVISDDGWMSSDGTTNLGADDAAGITIILLGIEHLLSEDLPHAPILLLFTVQEEIGLVGARSFDYASWGVHEGMIFDNADAPGVVIERGSGYIAFDAVIKGIGGHPAKDLSSTASAIEIFRRVRQATGELDEGNTRISFGTISGGTARNAIADECRIEGEIRTQLDADDQKRLCEEMERDFAEAARSLGGSAEVRFKTLAANYHVNLEEPLAQAFRSACEQHGYPFATASTFVASDANALRSGLNVFTVSTGVVNEHSVAEKVQIEPIADLVPVLISVLTSYRSKN